MKKQLDTTKPQVMKETISEFHTLLKRHGSVAIVGIDDRTEWIISPKKTDEEFIAAIEQVVNDAIDGSSEVRTAESWDYGYKIEVVLRTRTDNDDGSEKVYLTFGNIF